MRNILIMTRGAALVLALATAAYCGLFASAQAAPGLSDSINVAQLPPPGPVPSTLAIEANDHVMGDPKAPIVVIEYASLTCPHCADFAVNTLPQVKKQYIDTGKVRWVYRDFPLDQYSARASMMAECAGNDRYFAIIEILFGSQANWIKINDMDGTIAELGKIGRLAGLPEADFKTCMANQPLLQSIIAERQAGEKLGVDSTPTFFINGTKASGAMPFAEFEKLLK